MYHASPGNGNLGRGIEGVGLSGSGRNDLPEALGERRDLCDRGATVVGAGAVARRR